MFSEYWKYSLTYVDIARDWLFQFDNVKLNVIPDYKTIQIGHNIYHQHLCNSADSILPMHYI